MWNHHHDCFGWLVDIYIMLIVKKVDLHIGWPVLPHGLAVMDESLALRERVALVPSFG